MKKSEVCHVRSVGHAPRRGQVTVCFAVGVVPVLVGILCLTADVGRMVTERARLQSAADAAVLAGAQVLLHQQVDHVDEPTARAAALAEANSLSYANCPRAGLSVEFGRKGATGAFEPVDTATKATAIRAKAFRSKDAPGGPLALAFAGFFGRGNCTPEAVAAAEIGYDIVAVQGAVAPFGIPYSPQYAVEAETDADEILRFYPCDGDLYDDVQDKTSLPGCFGLLNLDGGELSTTEIIDWITNGYDGGVELDTSKDPASLPVPGTSGFRAALQKTMNQLIGKDIIIMVYDTASGQGATSIFNCVGFVCGRITTCRLTGNDPCIEFTISKVGTTYEEVTVGDSPLDLNLRKIQLIQ
jgi:hypothetical protein